MTDAAVDAAADLTGWSLSGSSETPGWLEIPPRADLAVEGGWIGACADELRAAWGDAWEPVHDDLVPRLLHAALEHRLDEDALAFQIWPTTAPVCVFVHVAVGAVDPSMPAPANATLYESEGLGPGIHLPSVDVVAGARVQGSDFLFRREGHAVSVSVEPTLPELLAILMPAVHAFVQSLTLTGQDGEWFRAQTPSLVGAAEPWDL